MNSIWTIRCLAAPGGPRCKVVPSDSRRRSPPFSRRRCTDGRRHAGGRPVRCRRRMLRQRGRAAGSLGRDRTAVSPGGRQARGTRRLPARFPGPERAAISEFRPKPASADGCSAAVVCRRRSFYRHSWVAAVAASARTDGRGRIDDSGRSGGRRRCHPGCPEMPELPPVRCVEHDGVPWPMFNIPNLKCLVERHLQLKKSQ